MTPSHPDDATVRSVRRAVAILRAFGPADHRLPLGEIARRAGLDKATARRLLRTLIEERLVEQDRPSRDYALSLGVLSLSAGATAADPLRRRARTLLAAVAETTGATAFLAVVHDGAAVCIEALAGARVDSPSVAIGERAPLHSCAAPRVLMAFLPLEARRALLAAPLPAVTPTTPTDPARLSEMLDAIRARGWETGHDEAGSGVSSLALPVHDAGGAVIAALGVTGPAAPAPEGDRPRHLATLLGKLRAWEGGAPPAAPRPRRGTARVADGRPRTP